MEFFFKWNESSTKVMETKGAQKDKQWLYHFRLFMFSNLFSMKLFLAFDQEVVLRHKEMSQWAVL